jgi:hypothetical protein
VNPDLVKAARAIVAARKQYPDLSEQEVETIAKSYGQKADDVVGYIQKLRGDHGDLVASGLGGFTANFGDEIVGLLPKSLGGGEAGKEEMRLRKELAEVDHPVAAPAAELAGGVTSTAMTGGLAPNLQVGGRVASAAANAAAVGGTYGALAGAGAGEGAADRLRRAATEGVAGAVLGGGIGAVAGRIAEHTSVSSALRRQLDAIDQSGGFQRIKQRLAEFRAAGRGNEVITADLAPELQNLADFAAQNDSRTYNKAARILNERQPDITERILSDVKDIAGEPLPDAAKMAQQLKDEKYDWANTAYGKLREVQAPVEPEAVQKLISTPTIDHLMQQAALADDMKGSDALAKLLERLRAGSRAPEDISAARQMANSGRRSMSFNDLHQLERALDGRVGTAYRKGNVPLADAYKAVRGQVRDLLTQVSPDYAKVTAEYAAKSQLQEMLTKGVDTWNKIGVRELSDDLSKLSPEDAELFRYGLASKLVDTLRDSNTNRNVAKQIMDKGISMQEKLKVIFGTPEKFDEFMARVHAEKSMGETRGVLGGSVTHKRDADTMFNPLPALAGAAYGPHGVMSSLLHHFAGNAGKTETRAVAAKIGDSMFTQGADKVDALLRALATPVNILGHRTTTSIGQGAGILTNLFSN